MVGFGHELQISLQILCKNKHFFANKLSFLLILQKIFAKIEFSMETSSKNAAGEDCQIDMSSAVKDQQPKKHRATVTATILVVLLLIAAGGGFVYFKWFANPLRGMTEVEAWSEIARFQTEQNVDSLETVLHYYLDNYPEEKHATDAQNLLDRLERERREWMDMLMYNCSVEAVDNYVYVNPEGFFHDQAVHVLDSLTYKQALHDNNEDGYLGYLSQFPKGMYADEAAKKLEEITNAELTDEEREKVEAVVKRHFETLQDNSADILETVAHDLASYFGKHQLHASCSRTVGCQDFRDRRIHGS